MITTVSGAKALQSALRTAEAGDTILLKSGSYGALQLDGVEGVKIAAAAGATPVFKALEVDGGKGLTLEGLEIDLSGGGRFAVLRSHDVDLVDLNVHGSLDGNPRNDPGGLLIRSSSDVRVVDSEFSQLEWGVGHLDVDGLVVRDSDFHNLQFDGVRGGGSSNVIISGNSFRDFFPKGRDHPDAIQFWTTNTKGAARNILIEDNVFLRGEGQPVQGIFLRDQVGDLPYEDVVIRGNLIAGGGYNGISLNGGRDVTVEDNIVQGFVGLKSWIRLLDVQGGRIDGNATNLVLVQKSRNVTESDNEVLPLARDHGAEALRMWNEDRDGASKDPDRPVPPQTNPPPSTPSPTHDARDHGAIAGDSGANLLSGDDRDNLVLARGGADTIVGLAGADTLVGGAGADRFVFLRGDGRDVVQDFGARGEADVIDASALLVTGATARLSQVGDDVSIAFSTGERILLENVSLDELEATSTGWIFS